MTRSSRDPLSHIAIVCAVTAGVLVLFAAVARAATAPDPTPTVLGLPWEAWIAIGLGAFAGVRALVDLLLAFFKVEAPLTKTLIDDHFRDSLQRAHDKLDKLAGMVNGIANATRQPGAVPIFPVPGGTAAMLVVLLLGAAGGGLALSSCAATTAAGHAAKPAIVNCTAQDLGTAPALNLETLVAVANTVAAERAACMTAGGLDWKCVERDAIGKGLVLGGCALAEMVAAAANALHPAGPGLVAGDPAPPPGRAELERFRAQVAGGATYHTAAGDL